MNVLLIDADGEITIPGVELSPPAAKALAARLAAAHKGVIFDDADGDLVVFAEPAGL